jgi:peptide chain release factor 2
MRAEIENIVEEINDALELLKQRMDWETAPHRLEEFNAMSEDPDLWNDPAKAQKLMRERQMLVDAMENYQSLAQDLADNVELIELGEMEEDQEIVDEAEKAIKKLEKVAAKRK